MYWCSKVVHFRAFQVIDFEIQFLSDKHPSLADGHDFPI